jgi:4-amino-4-deoxy-L-arabinose transferase-like glycosyltransferase
VTSTDAADRRFYVALGGLAALGLAVRIAFALAASFDAAPGPNDPYNYHLLGRFLAEGDGYIRAFDRLDGAHLPTAEFPPVFPSLIAVLHLLGIRSVSGQELALSVLGTVTVILIGLVAREVAGQRAGLIAAGIAVAYPMLLLPDATLQSEGLMAALVAAALFLALRAHDRRLLILLGVVIGLATLTRSEGLLLLPLMVWPAVRSPRAVLLATLPVLALVGMWTARNAVRLDHLVPLSNNTGTLVAGANCRDSWHGKHEGLWLFSCTTTIDTDGLDETERTRRYVRTGIEYIGDHPARLPKIVAVRELRLFGLWSPRNQLDWEALEGRNRTALWVGWVVYLVVLPLAVAGALLGRRRRLRISPLLGCVAAVALLAAATYGHQRFRITAEPALLVLAGVALDAGWTAVRRR